MGAAISILHLKAEEWFSFEGDLLDLKRKYFFFSSLKSLRRKPKVFCNVTVFSIGFEDEDWRLFARVFVTDEKYSLRNLENLSESEVISSIFSI